VASEKRRHREREPRDRKKALDSDLTNSHTAMRGYGFVAILVTAMLSQFATPMSSGQQLAEVVGTVRDVTGASIAGATVEFISQGTHYTVTVSNVGGYAERLTPGTYSVTARAPYFCEEHRAAFSIAADQKAEFDFILPTGTTDTTPRNDGCYKEDAPDMGKGELHPLVLYGARSQKGAEIFYSGLKHRFPRVNENYPAVFSCGLLTLQGDSLQFDSQAASITAIGSVALQNGVQTQHASEINIEFARGDVIVKVIR
jgi:hypothetical protein